MHAVQDARTRSTDQHTCTARNIVIIRLILIARANFEIRVKHARARARSHDQLQAIASYRFRNSNL